MASKAPCFLRCLVCFKLPLKIRMLVLFSPLVVPISAAGLQGVQPLVFWNKVGKGSRQTRSVTLGKGLARRVGCRGPCTDACAGQHLPDASDG